MSSNAQLSMEAIIYAGRDLASQPGTFQISFRDLGRELKCDHSAIYRYVRNKEELMRLLLDSLLRDAVEGVPVTVTHWRDRLEVFAALLLEAFIRYPCIGAEAVILTTYGIGELDAVEFMLDAFKSGGLEGDPLVHYYGVYSSHVLSRASGIARSRSVRAVGPEESVPWVDAPLVVDKRQHPLVYQFQSGLLGLVDNELYMSSTRLILDSAEKKIALPPMPANEDSEASSEEGIGTERSEVAEWRSWLWARKMTSAPGTGDRTPV